MYTRRDWSVPATPSDPATAPDTVVGSVPDPTPAVETVAPESPPLEPPPAADAATPVPVTPVAHPPAIQAMLDQALHGDTRVTKNLAVLVGTIQLDTNKGGHHRKITTSTGDQQKQYYLVISEELGGEHGADRSTYRLQLSISRTLVDRYADLLVEGQRIQLISTIKRERSHDRSLSLSQDDLGRPTWAIQFEIIDCQEAPPEVSDYSLIVLHGEIKDDPIPRRQPLDQGFFTYFASVMLLNRLRVKSSRPGARGFFPQAYLLPLQVSLDDPPDHAGAVLKKGCTVRIEGRLRPYVVRRNPTHDQRLQAALATREMHWQKAFLLNDLRWTIEVSFVEYMDGAQPLDADAIAALRTEADTRANQRRTDQAAEPASTVAPDPDTVTAALDAATQTMLAERAPDVDPDPPATGDPPGRPRRRTAARSAAAAVTTEEAGDDDPAG